MDVIFSLGFKPQRFNVTGRCKVLDATGHKVCTESCVRKSKMCLFVGVVGGGLGGKGSFKSFDVFISEHVLYCSRKGPV